MSNKIEVNRKTLLASLKRLKHFVPKNTVLPVLECILVKCTDKELVMYATDLESWIIETLEVKGVRPFAKGILVDIKWLLSIVTSSNCESVYIEQPTDSSMSFKLHCNDDTHKMDSLDKADNYPKPPALDENIKYSFPSYTSEFKKQISIAVPTISDDDLRPAMTGISLAKNTKGDGLAICATDAHCLYFNESGLNCPIEIATEFKNVIIPKKPCVFLAKNDLGVCDFNFHILNTHSNISIIGKTTTIHIRTIDANFPDYKVVLDSAKGNQVKASFDRNRLVAICKLAKEVSNRSTAQITINIENGITKVKAEDLDFSTESEFSIPSFSIGEQKKLSIALNSILLRRCIESLKTEQVTFQNCGEANKAVIINDCYLIMHLMLNN